MSDNIKEKLIEEQPTPVDLDGTKTILSQMENCICKIVKDNGEKGTGFFCRIPFPDENHLLNVLITNNHILNEIDIENNKIIKFKIYNKEKKKEEEKKIRIDNSRKKFTIKKEEEGIDITIIEIKPNKDNINNFLDIDNEILELDCNRKSIYILNYPEDKRLVSYGLMKGVLDSKKIDHFCNTKEGSSGSPILSLNNFKVIGIHYGGLKNNNIKVNFGAFIEYVINAFNDKYQNENKNEYKKYNKVMNSNENKIEEELNLEEFNNKDNEIKINETKILVNNINDKNIENKEILKQSKDIICPECGEICLMDIKDYKIILNNCKNKHNRENILFDEYNNLQKINELDILCDICKKNKKEIYNNQLYKCCKCKIIICSLCKSKHNKEHRLIDYELKNYLCNKHGERYISFCKDCNSNLCDLCEIEHNKNNKNHNSLYLNKLINNENKNINELKIKIDNLKFEINDIIIKFNIIKDNMDIYYNIYHKIINNYDLKNKNYEKLMNINNIYNFNKIVIKDINNIIN